MKHRATGDANQRSGAWYADPHGFVERATTVRRRRGYLRRLTHSLVPEVTLWGWADTDGARTIRENTDPPLGAATAPTTPDGQREIQVPDLDIRQIHPPFTPE
jgi:hypothetical protein